MAGLRPKGERAHALSAGPHKKTRPTEEARNTKGERTVRMWLIRNGFKFEADPVIRGSLKASFQVDGVYIFVAHRFWHDPTYTAMTMTRAVQAKVKQNHERDQQIERFLLRAEKKFIRIWDSDLKNPKRWKVKLLKALGKE